VNLGPEINSPGLDFGLTLTASGEYGFVTSSNNSIGGTDIFRVNMPEAIRPKPVVLITGRVLDQKSKKPLGASITYSLLASDKVVGLASSNPVDGSYKIVLPAGEAYSFLGEKENFYSISENFDVKDLTGYKEIKKDLFLAPVEVGSKIRMNNIFFDLGKSELRPESRPELDRAAEFLRKNPTISIEIGGHTDNVGNVANNLKLSEERAKAVENYLLEKQILAARLRSKGYGKSKPVGKNTSEEGRQLNRRVEFIITKK
jgi:outer membrane protein OmpA-like peptidoglycan-associated protein